MSEKILSVSVAAYNVADTLREALDPFTQETVAKRVDVMIVDDGSKDETAKIASEYEAKYPGTFRLLSKENGGWGSTLNIGIKAAKGKYFKQLDGDDYYSWENLAAFLDFLEKSDADMVYSPFVTFEDKTGAVLRVLGKYEGTFRFLPLKNTVLLTECENFMPAMHSLTVRSDVLKRKRVTITEHCFYTDVEFVLKSYNLCKTVSFFERPVYYYRLARNGQSMSLGGVRKHYGDHQKMLMKMLSYYEQEVKEPIKKRQIRDRLAAACTMQYIFYMALECTSKQKQELKQFDKELKEKHPYFYEREKGNQVCMLRRTNFAGYWLISQQKMRKDKKLHINIFEGA